jgi:hypothetical protein
MLLQISGLKEQCASHVTYSATGLSPPSARTVSPSRPTTIFLDAISKPKEDSLLKSDTTGRLSS